MKKNSTNYAIKMLGFTVIALMAMLNPAFSQEPAIDNDLITYSMAVSPNQQVKFRFPLDMRSGDRISGTVVEEKKSNAGEANKTSSTLEGVVIEIDGKQTKLSNRIFSFIVPAGITSLPFLLKNAAGEIIQQGELPVGIANSISSPEAGTDVYPSAVCQPGQPLTISGNFDGNASNTNVSLGGQNCEVIAESNRMSIVQVPQNATAGIKPITIEEFGIGGASKKMNVLVLDLKANKTTLLKGEKTTITVRVSGLEGLDYKKSNLKIRLENQSPQTIVFLKENNVIIKEINAESVKNGKYEFSTRISALTKGAFKVTATITSPKDDNDCVKKYQDCMAQIKANKEIAIKKCQDAGGAGLDDCITQVNTASEKLEKACFDEFLKCKK
jgi:hypothetical protein